jgi:outer membrane receptor protein involved in Fe transport
MRPAGTVSSDTQASPDLFPPTRMRTQSLSAPVVATRILIGATALAMVPMIAAAQSGSLRGTISAASSHEPLFGARVAVQVPLRVATTDASGRYLVRDLPAGSYDVLITALGRKPLHKGVDIRAGETATLDVELDPGSLVVSGVISTATRSPIEANLVATTVNTLTPEQVQTSPASESQDLLREIPGVELPRTSSNYGGTAQIVSIRGTDEGRTAVLFDGVPITDAWGEWVDWSRVPKAMVDHVEVLEGGGSSLYGNPAMGGVISFIRKPVSPGAVQLQIDGGQRDARHIFAATAAPVGPLGVSLGGDYGDGGGYTALQESQRGAVDVPYTTIRRNGFARVDYAPSSRVQAFAGLNLFSDGRGLGTPLTSAKRRASTTTLGLDVGELAQGLLSVRAWNTEQREDQIASSVSNANGPRSGETKSSWSHIPSHDRGATLLWARDGMFGLETFTLGGDVKHLHGVVAEEDYNSSGTVTQNILSGGDQLLLGAFAHGVLVPVTPLRIEFGARIDSWGNDNGFAVDASGTTHYDNKTRTALSPRLGVRYQIVPKFAVQSAVYHAFRAPNLAQLYRKSITSSRISLPNPELKPEFVTGEELGFDWQPIDWLQMRGTIYQADMTDLNTFVQTSAGPPVERQRQNVEGTRSRGGELYLALRPVDQLFFSTSFNYDDDRVTDAGASGAEEGTRTGRVPLQKVVVRATYTSQMLGAWTALVRHEGEATNFSGDLMAQFTVLDADVRRELRSGASAFISVENVLDRKIQVAIGSTTQYGLPRTLRAGVSWSRF